MQGTLQFGKNFLLLVLAGFSSFSRADTVSDFEALLPSVVQSFLLLDEQGQPGPALPPGSTASPFGALLEFSNPKPGVGANLTFTLNACSATHLITGQVVSAKSCLLAMGTGAKAWVYLVYYDSVGKRQSVAVDRIEPGKDGSTITIPLAPATSNGWSSVLAKEFPDAEDAWDDPESWLGVTVWAYDTLSLRPDVAKNHLAADGSTPYGLVFNPRKECLASPNNPLLGIAKNEAPKREVGKIKLGMEEHRGPLVYFDSCDNAFIGGNPGALISASGDLQSPIGIYVNTVTMDNLWTRLSKVKDPLISQAVAQPGAHLFYFHQADGKVESFSPYLKTAGSNGLFSVGKIFPYLEAYLPQEREPNETP